MTQVMMPGAGIAPVGDITESFAKNAGTKQIGPPTPTGADARKQELALRIMGRWAEASSYMMQARKDYWQNLAFYLGRQWVWWSNQRNALMEYPENTNPIGAGRVVLTINRFAPNIDNVFGRLNRSELAFEVPPSDSSDPVVKGAKRAEELLESKRIEQRWDTIRGDAILATLFGGTAALAVEWDGLAGKAIELPGQDGPAQGDPVYDDQSAQYLSTGDVSLRAYNVTEFAVEPGVRSKAEAHWWISGLALPCATAQEMYELNWTPYPDASAQHSPLSTSLLRDSGRPVGDNLCFVACYYERPTRRNGGRYVVVINSTVVFESEWPFPFPELNLHLMRQKRRDNQWLGSTYCNDAVPVQTAYNLARSVLAEHLKIAGNARLLAPYGSIHEEDLYSAAGELLPYSPDGMNAEPKWLIPPQLARWVTGEPEQLAAELDNIMGVRDISRGIGFSRASGQALSFLAEQDDSSLGHMAFEQKYVWEDIGTQTLKLCAENATETRTSSISLAPGLTKKLEWNGRSLQGQTRCVVPMEAVTPKNSAARAANAKDLWDRKIITDPRKYARMSGIPAEDFEQLLDPDAALANRENLRMAMGEAVLCNPFDDHAKHIAEHNDRLRKTDSYLFAEKEDRKMIDNHVAMHEAMAAQEFAKQDALAQQAGPAATGIPQADAPEGSNVPMGEQEETGKLGMMAQMGVSPNGGSSAGGNGPPGATAPTGADGGMG